VARQIREEGGQVPALYGPGRVHLYNTLISLA
jgi:hypothetical protein